MIKIPKKLSYSSPLRIALSISILSLAYLAVPLFLVLVVHLFTPRALVIFYPVTIVGACVIVNRTLNRRYQIEHDLQDTREKINILRSESEIYAAGHAALSTRIVRYSNLGAAIEKINASLDSEAIAGNLIDVTHALLAGAEGTCLLYLVDPVAQKLCLFKSKKEDARQIIKAKEGDIFDHWVVKHSSPLLITDIREDFRFDRDKISGSDTRPVVSLVAAPFVIGGEFLGILRLDSLKPRAYTLDDLRLLVTLSDVGAVALGNGGLFKKTQELAIHDGLTALYTKSFFLERLREEIKRSSRSLSGFSLVLLDIDHFKNYNDTFGHIAGDIVLKKLSAVVSDTLKRLDPLVCRFGGEEFCVLLTHTDKERAHALAEDVRQRVASLPLHLRRQVTNVTISAGVAAFPQDGRYEDELIIKADRAMYEAKQAGRNRVIDAH